MIEGKPSDLIGNDLPIDTGVLRNWLKTKQVGDHEVTNPRLLAGGTQNVLMAFEHGGRSLVLRRPPPHKRANSDWTMVREARILKALAHSEVPHPGFVAAEESTELIGASFYVMERKDGFNLTLGAPQIFHDQPELQAGLVPAMVNTLCAFDRFDPIAGGLEGLSRTENWAERQVGKWRDLLASYDSHEGYEREDLEGVDELSRWLSLNLPGDLKLGLVHGDFHFANVLICGDRAEVSAVVDWELGSLGDRRLDIGHLMATWPGVMPRESPVGVEQLEHLPGPGALLELYCEQSNNTPEELVFFRVLAAYRLGLILEGTQARAAAGLAPIDTGQQLHDTADNLVKLAHEIIATS